ncbi:MAG: hypothetical protein RLZZ157_322 [Pseudomonadota bacterium]|jgi:zinc/manganese transport system ATP-binding protein
MSIALKDVSIGHQRQMLAGPFNMAIAKGSCVALLGPNGSGKSTLLRTLAGDLRPVRGQISISPATTRAYLAQSQSHMKAAPLSVRELVAMGLWSKLGMFGRPCRHDQGAVDSALETTGLTHVAHMPIGAVSGGQVQRALFARLMVQDCSLILLDEPFTALDDNSAQIVLDIITHWHRQGKTIVAALHDRAIARHFALWLDLDTADAPVLQPSMPGALSPADGGLRVIAGGAA